MPEKYRNLLSNQDTRQILEAHGVDNLDDDQQIALEILLDEVGGFNNVSRTKFYRRTREVSKTLGIKATEIGILVRDLSEATRSQHFHIYRVIDPVRFLEEPPFPF